MSDVRGESINPAEGKFGCSTCCQPARYAKIDADGKFGCSTCCQPARYAKIDADGNRTHFCEKHFPRCSGCRFYRSTGHDAGECRRKPPVIVLTHEGFRSAFPDVCAGDWCGKFKPPA